MEYSEKLRDPRWQKRRLQVFERDGWKCRRCGCEDNTLAVHHRQYYPHMEPWEYPDADLETLCEFCHEEEREVRPDYERWLVVTLRKNGWPARNIKVLVNTVALNEAYKNQVLSLWDQYQMAQEGHRHG